MRPLSCHYETVNGQDSGQDCECKQAALWPRNKTIKQILNYYSIQLKLVYQYY